MSYIDFFNSNPVFASIVTLCYLVLVGIFIYILVQLYRK